MNTDTGALAPEKDHDRPKKLIDYNVVMKGGRGASKKTKDNQKADDLFFE
jgi:hypothetical protein